MTNWKLWYTRLSYMCMNLKYLQCYSIKYLDMLTYISSSKWSFQKNIIRYFNCASEQLINN